MTNIIYNKIGANYNTTRKADPYLLSRMLFYLEPKPGKKLLDLGCGTGNYTSEIVKHGFDVTGVDPSEKMLNEAKSKSSAIKWLHGFAEQLPLENNVFDNVLATLTIHHWNNLELGMQEVQRVLKPGGKTVIFTSTPNQMRGYWLYHYFPEAIEKACAQMPSLLQVERACTLAGMKIVTTEKYFIKDDLQDQFLYVGKNMPEIYFDETLRNGISTFAALADNKEVEKGLRQLKTDIDSGAFNQVKEEYTNELGDYLFVVAMKQN